MATERFSGPSGGAALLQNQHQSHISPEAGLAQPQEGLERKEGDESPLQGKPLNIPPEWRQMLKEEVMNIVNKRANWEALARNLGLPTTEKAQQHFERMYVTEYPNLPHPHLHFLTHEILTLAPNQKLKVHPHNKPLISQWETAYIQHLVVMDRLGEKPMVVNLANEYAIGGHVFEGNTAQEESLLRFSNAFLGMPAPNPEKVDHYPNRRGFEQIGGGFWVENVTPFEGVGSCATPRPDNMYHKVAVAGPDFRVDHLKVPVDVMEFRLLWLQRFQEDRSAYVERLERIVRVCAEATLAAGSNTLVLGAVGCGVFKNNPYLFAATSRAVLSEPKYTHLKVVFDATGFPHDFSALYPASLVEVFRYAYEQLTPQQASDLIYDPDIPVNRANDRDFEALFSHLDKTKYPPHRPGFTLYQPVEVRLGEGGEAEGAEGELEGQAAGERAEGEEEKDHPPVPQSRTSSAVQEERWFAPCKSVTVSFQGEGDTTIDPPAQAQKLLSEMASATENEGQSPFSQELITCAMSKDLAEEIEKIYNSYGRKTCDANQALVALFTARPNLKSSGQVKVMHEVLRLAVQDPTWAGRIRISPVATTVIMNRGGEKGHRIRRPVTQQEIDQWIDKQQDAINTGEARVWLFRNQTTKPTDVAALSGQIAFDPNVNQHAQARYRGFLMMKPGAAIDVGPRVVEDGGESPAPRTGGWGALFSSSKLVPSAPKEGKKEALLTEMVAAIHQAAASPAFDPTQRHQSLSLAVSSNQQLLTPSKILLGAIGAAVMVGDQDTALRNKLTVKLNVLAQDTIESINLLIGKDTSFAEKDLQGQKWTDPAFTAFQTALKEIRQVNVKSPQDCIMLFERLAAAVERGMYAGHLQPVCNCFAAIKQSGILPTIDALVHAKVQLRELVAPPISAEEAKRLQAEVDRRQQEAAARSPVVAPRAAGLDYAEYERVVPRTKVAFDAFRNLWGGKKP